MTAAYCLLCGLSLIPFLWFSEPPITDFANHAARLFIACHQSDSAFAAMYQYRIGIIPNLAVDAVNLPFCGLVGSSMLLRLVTAGSLALIYLSGWMIQRKLFGRPNAFLFLVPAIAFNLVTLMGYMNYLAGIAIVCLMVAWAVGGERPLKSLMLVCNIGGLALFFCHIFALVFGMMVFFGLMLTREELTVSGIFRAGVRTLAMFAAPIAMMGFVPTSEHGLRIGYGDKLRAFPPLIMSKTFSMRLCGVGLIAALYLAVRNKLAEISPALSLSLAVVGLFVVFGPNQIQQGYDVDVRTLVALAYLGLMSLKPLRLEARTTAIVGAASAVLVGTQLWAAVTIWQPFARQVDEFRSATDVLPAAARVLPLTDVNDSGLVAWPTAYIHVTSYATIDRHIFNPLDFTGVGMQPLVATPAFAPISPGVGAVIYSSEANKLADPTPMTEQAASHYRPYGFALHWPQKFDYVVYYHFGRPKNFNPAALTEVRSGRFFTIFKVKHPAPATPETR
ncbi:MAG TPA: hypothetical protein VF098_06010 [Sphingomicrobium sp.]